MNKYTNTYIQKLGNELEKENKSKAQEDETKKLTALQKIKRTIRDTVTGAAIGAGAGGLAGGMGAETLRDWLVATSSGSPLNNISWFNEMTMPKARVQAASVPAGILGGAGLGALGGLLLPHLYRD